MKNKYLWHIFTAIPLGLLLISGYEWKETGKLPSKEILIGYVIIVLVLELLSFIQDKIADYKYGKDE